jgi:hypothetical protein
VQAREDGTADVAGQVPAGIGDVHGGGDEVLGGFDGDLPSGPVRVGAGHGLDGVVTAVRRVPGVTIRCSRRCPGSSLANAAMVEPAPVILTAGLADACGAGDGEHGAPADREQVEAALDRPEACSERGQRLGEAEEGQAGGHGIAQSCGDGSQRVPIVAARWAH